MMKPVDDTVHPFKIGVTDDVHTVIIRRLFFGDVWLCSGQSNMQFTVPMVSVYRELNKENEKVKDV